MPVEILHGEADKTVGLEIHSAPLAAQVPHARFTRLPGIGHMLHQVATPEVVARIDGWVAGVDGRTERRRDGLRSVKQTVEREPQASLVS